MHNSNSTLLFHISDKLIENFISSNKRPNFYWFSDSYHSHLTGDQPGGDYIYFFLVKPSGRSKLFTRHGSGDFTSLWLDYQQYLKDRISPGYHEPGIVYSFSDLVPIVTGKFTEGFNVDASRTDTNLQVSFSLGMPDAFTRFNNIPELVKLLPEILEAVPIANPSSKTSDFWSQDIENAGRFWL